LLRTLGKSATHFRNRSCNIRYRSCNTQTGAPEAAAAPIFPTGESAIVWCGPVKRYRYPLNDCGESAWFQPDVMGRTSVAATAPRALPLISPSWLCATAALKKSRTQQCDQICATSTRKETDRSGLAPPFCATTVLPRCLSQGHETVTGCSIKSQRCCRPCRIEGLSALCPSCRKRLPTVERPMPKARSV
jgi:hypothetical protein